jgi:hypothetical protein
MANRTILTRGHHIYPTIPDVCLLVAYQGKLRLCRAGELAP